MILQVAGNRHTCCCIHCSAGHETSLDKLMRIATHDLSIFAGSWLSLIGIDDKVAWSKQM